MNSAASCVNFYRSELIRHVDRQISSGILVVAMYSDGNIAKLLKLKILKAGDVKIINEWS